MSFRITPQHITANAVRFSRGHLDNLARLQQMLSSNLRISKPSDDPGAIAPLLANKATVNRIEIDLQNIQAARSSLDQSVSQLQTVGQDLASALQMAQQGTDSDLTVRETLADSINGVLEELLAIANSSQGGHPLYAGTSAIPEPFQVAERNAAGEITSVTYHGSADRSRVVVGLRATVDTLYSGAEVFGDDGRGKTTLIGQTGVLPGSGTDSGIGRATLQVRHTATVFGGASGIQPGTQTALDTVLGNHTLSIDAVQHTLQLDNGNPVTYTPGDSNVRIENDNGLLLYVDTSALTAGFVGTVSVQGQGTLSTDQGLSQIPIDFSTNQVVTDSVTGQVMNVDTSQVHTAGVEHVEYEETSDVFQTLIELRDDLRNTRQLSTSDSADAIQRRIADVTRVHEHILKIVGEQSVTLQHLDSIQSRAEELSLTTKESIGELESADMAEVAIQLETERTALQFTYSAAMRLMDTTILDYLQ